MGRENGVAGTTRDSARRGLWRLMLKLPALRGQLQIIAAQTTDLNELFEAYEMAASALERFRKEEDRTRVREYETICSAIEEDIIQHWRMSSEANNSPKPPTR
ncbi:hypothetical protein EN837_21805 [bacterium M00.F.Ca.ET.194.01.1.1]|nr:hypothetical protein EN837_21805 [bacterium M00.F.Ca.ET.194.01.1.1]TGS52652.1 hypothetical protein EN822_23005 [bacterium M00.F.Ca.ET.179.01.1.1]TGV44508.1 hypothetical protein EN811_23005 [bacterium M00.F.Ca.ET.168.01.1.1]